ncbi:MAG TPA: hypothetical protein VN213_07790, partial [Solirubrobacteraceae bacterium]|nr:hypothetical protein [Solirubrobacteraceae bacterium]
RLAVLAAGADEAAAQRLADEIAAEFGLGPDVAVALAVRRGTDDGDAVLAAARRGLALVAAPAGRKAE